MREAGRSRTLLSRHFCSSGKNTIKKNYIYICVSINNIDIDTHEIHTYFQSIYNTQKIYQEILKNTWMSFTALLKQNEIEVKGRADNFTGT